MASSHDACFDPRPDLAPERLAFIDGCGTSILAASKMTARMVRM